MQTQVLGPGAFQEIDLSAAFNSVAEWSQTVLSNQNASELMALAIKHAVVKRDVSHLIFPDEVAFSPGTDVSPTNTASRSHQRRADRAATGAVG